MRWWNDLWLNESFATYMSFLAAENCPSVSKKFPTNQHEVLDFKFEAVPIDCCSRAHPITCPVSSTDQAMANFDGIMYGKGASVLKQLVKFIGHDIMKKSLKVYFERHRWRNTELKDFVNAVKDVYEAHAPQRVIDIEKFCDQWLASSGVNILTPFPEIDFETGVLRRLQIG